jgi:ribosomal-protein-alanine N-acetyltransferase
MIVRSAKQEDLTGVIEIDKLSFANPWDRQFLENISKDIFLVFSGSEVYGFLIAGCCHRNVTASILKIAVHPQHRRKGIATNLLDTLLERLGDKQIYEVEVNVLKECESAISFYKKVGFEITATMEQGSLNDDIYLMELKVP